jgi:hypothetical protein
MEAAVSVTDAEFALIVRGEASEDLKARFLREAKDPAGELRHVLRGAREWAGRLNQTCPSPRASETPATDVLRMPVPLRHAAFADTRQALPDQPVTQKDLAEVILGTASQETILRLQNALEDPASELSMLVGNLSDE